MVYTRHFHFLVMGCHLPPQHVQTLHSPLTFASCPFSQASYSKADIFYNKCSTVLWRSTTVLARDEWCEWGEQEKREHGSTWALWYSGPLHSHPKEHMPLGMSCLIQHTCSLVWEWSGLLYHNAQVLPNTLFSCLHHSTATAIIV